MYKVKRIGYKATVKFYDGEEGTTRLFPVSDKGVLESRCEEWMKRGMITEYKIKSVTVEATA